MRYPLGLTQESHAAAGCHGEAQPNPGAPGWLSNKSLFAAADQILHFVQDDNRFVQDDNTGRPT